LGLDFVQSNGFSVSLSPDAKNTSAATGTASSANNNGTVSGGVNGRNVDFTIHWNGGAQGHYTGTVSDDGNVHGGATVDVANPGSGASWDSTTPLVCLGTAAPDQVPLPRPGVPTALQPAAPIGKAPPLAQPPPVTDAIALSFGPPGFGSITATVTNSSDLTARCTYDASGLTKTHRDFTVSPQGSTDLTFNGFNTGTTYHVVVSCHDASGTQTQEIGHAEQDVTF
jgi:hypothetical protein